MLRLLSALLALLSTSGTMAGADENWPHWRGPTGNGHAAATAQPPLTWDAATGKNVRWKAALAGRGSATPIVWGEQVFILSAEKTDRAAKPDELPPPRPGVEQAMTTPPQHFYRFLVTSFHRDTGKQLWQRVAAEAVPHEGHHETHSYAGGSPTTDGERLYVSFGSFGVFCYDLRGELLWRRDLGRMTTRRGWGEAVTPVHHDGKLLLNWDQEIDAALYCLDAKTGATLWRAARDEVTTWTTPLVTQFEGRTQVILNGTNRIRSHDIETGEVLWSCGGMTVNAIPSVLRFGDAVIATSGYRGSAAVSIPLAARGDLPAEGAVNWRFGQATPYVPTPILVEDYLYFTGGNGNLLTILEAATGKPILERQRLPAVRQFYASPILAAERLYFTDRDGTTLVLKPGPKPEVLATNRLDDGVDASPVAVGRHLFLRGERFLYCLEDSAAR